MRASPQARPQPPAAHARAARRAEFFDNHCGPLYAARRNRRRVGPVAFRISRDMFGGECDSPPLFFPAAMPERPVSWRR